MPKSTEEFGTNPLPMISTIIPLTREASSFPDVSTGIGLRILIVDDDCTEASETSEHLMVVCPVDVGGVYTPAADIVPGAASDSLASPTDQVNGPSEEPLILAVYWAVSPIRTLDGPVMVSRLLLSGDVEVT